MTPNDLLGSVFPIDNDTAIVGTWDIPYQEMQSWLANGVLPPCRDLDNLRGACTLSPVESMHLVRKFHPSVKFVVGLSLDTCGLRIHAIVSNTACTHEPVDNGTKLSECRHCYKRMILKDWAWRVA